VTDLYFAVDAETAFRLLCDLPGSEAPTMHADALSKRPNTSRTIRTVMIVGTEPDERILETATDAGGYDVILVEPTATAYSRIKRLSPSAVVLTMTMDDLEACQLMSMLKLDRDTSNIPVFTCLLKPIADPSPL
jgi:response regulator RpfG family c-di-GMP phosphodiesterase